MAPSLFSLDKRLVIRAPATFLRLVRRKKVSIFNIKANTMIFKLLKTKALRGTFMLLMKDRVVEGGGRC